MSKLLYLLSRLLLPAACYLQATPTEYPRSKQTEYPQSKQTELKVGDRCPDLLFDHLLNSASKTVHLSDFKGRLVILDFWATWCEPCLRALSKLDSLKKEFGDELVILPVSYQQTAYVAKFLSQNSRYNFNDLIYVTEDTTIRTYFPYWFIPHEVWIDGDGRVEAITGDSEVNANNLKRYFANKSTRLKVKKDVLKFDLSKPLLAGELGDNYRINTEQIAYQSLFIRGYLDGAGSGVNAKQTDECTKRLYRNMTITNLYRFGPFLLKSDSSREPDPYVLYQPSMVRLEVTDSTLFDWPGLSPEDWEKKPKDNVQFTYEQYIPNKDSLKAGQYMLEDLNRYFGDLLGIQGLLEKQKVTC